MKHPYIYRFLLFITGIIISPLFAIAQTHIPAIQWEKSYGGSGAEFSGTIKRTVDGGYIIAGGSNSTDGDVTGNHGNDDYWIVKLDKNGNMQWEKSLGGSKDDIATAIIANNDGSYIVSGFSSSSDGDLNINHGGWDYWILKFDSLGNILWQKSLGGSQDDNAEDICATNDGGCIIAGYSSSSDYDVKINHGYDDYWLVKLDKNGKMQWEKSYGGSGYDRAYSIKQTNDSGYIVVGSSQSNDDDVTGHHGDSTTSDYWIVKLDSLGTIQWNKSLGGSKDDEAYNILLTHDGGYIISGYSNSTDDDVTGNHGSYDYWIVKLDSVGDIKWENSLGGSDEDFLNIGITNTTDNGYIIYGSSQSNDGEVTNHHGMTRIVDYWIVKIDNAGNLQWEKSLGGSGTDEATSIQQTTDGGYIVAGFSNSTDGDVTGNHGGYDYWIVKLGPDGDTAHASILATNPIDAGPVHVDSSKTVSFTITNTSVLENAVITQMSLQGAFASQYQLTPSPTLPDTIGPGSQTFEITFSPKQAGTLDAILHVVANASPSTMDIPVEGIGTRSVLAANPLNFDTVNLNDCKTLELTLRNAGSYPLTINQTDILGVYAGDYTILNSVTDTLYPGDTANIAIQYCPTASGEEDAIAEIITNDGDTLFVNIYGAGKGTSSVSNPVLAPFTTSLSQNYPNPFTGTTTIHVTLSQSDAEGAQLKIYNMLGEQVANLTGQLSPNADISFNAEENKAGVYYYMLQTASGRLTRQMFVVK